MRGSRGRYMAGADRSARARGEKGHRTLDHTAARGSAGGASSHRLKPGAPAPQIRWWPIAPSRARLAHGEVHMHRVCLDQPDDRVRALAAVLSTDEYERAERFQFAKDQQRYMVGRAC